MNIVNAATLVTELNERGTDTSALAMVLAYRRKIREQLLEELRNV